MSSDPQPSLLTVQYDVVQLDTVMRYFVKGYDATDPDRVIEDCTWYLDPVKGIVIFRLYVRAPHV